MAGGPVPSRPMIRNMLNRSSLPVSELTWHKVRHEITPGRTEPQVRFLLPIPVKGKPAEEEAASPCVQGVR